ncbi:undecaprenyl/decaprenyl-phosphate alpha-N-acetylglucosaminyl 1-phosphate transferase [Streptomyces sp. TRM66268-LWL]|uniref:Undecaprenyl/decaprenyl-phosphate alpha-N-acetylglucosaminyl 1-phosphate transferase n=1 Tax=Streptomyces polyasparticus TaxID=2767826 RepID=A0ABR7SHU7_9ACTN|nr:MraY family glycosyltransferase [Streptomyces polyasparticus]MBC9714414.1 undecaprenyl/decaprenyl-phosphate alpha-N-acetylglucosaminyl 1-phosphate transferase [Streptomyces polyasparticus]
MLYTLVAAVAAVLLTALLTRFVRVLALRTGLLDRPGARKAHSRPTPHLGGVAVAAGTLAVSCTGYAPLGPGTERLLWAASALALLGLVDDLRPLGARIRLVVETVAAFVVVYDTELTPLAAACALVWIVFVTNAFNLLDNSDGAMGTVGVVTALGLALCAAAEGRSGLALVLTVLAASLGGFLGHNWHPAKIFLGDCGSLFTGFLLASAAVTVHTGHETLPTALGLLTLTVVVTADTALVVVSRRRAGRPLLMGGTDHTAHRLRRVGFTVPGAAVVLGAVAFAGTLTTFLMHRGVAGPSAATPLLLAVIGGLWALLKVPVYGAQARLGGPATRTAAAGGARTPARTSARPVPTGALRTATAGRGRPVGGPRTVAAAAARPADGPRTLALRTSTTRTRPVPGTRASGTPAAGTFLPPGGGRTAAAPSGAQTSASTSGGRTPGVPSSGRAPGVPSSGRTSSTPAAGRPVAPPRGPKSPTPTGRTRRGLAALTRTVLAARRAQPGAHPTTADLARG